MPGHTCVVCGSTPMQDPDTSFHCLQSEPVRRASWIDAFGLEERQLKAEKQGFVASSSSWELSGPYRATITLILVQHGNLTARLG